MNGFLRVFKVKINKNVGQLRGNILFFVSILSILQSLAGTLNEATPDQLIGRWEGWLFQDPGGYHPTYKYSITFDKINTTYLSGVANVSLNNDSTIFAKFMVEASILGSMVMVVDQEILEQNIIDAHWCIKTLQLKFSKEEDSLYLKGHWMAPNCVFGTIKLSKPALNQSNNYHPTTDTIPKLHRKISTNKLIHVKNNEILLKIWDKDQEDGDRISLRLNNNWLLENQFIGKLKKELQIQLTQPQNKLILFADNLGTIPPNTIALSVDDGTSIQIITLQADFLSSESIIIQVDPDPK